LSGPNGTFTVSPITPGTYRIEVEAAGYKRALEDNVVIANAGPATVNVSLVSGNPADVVKFTATAHLIQTDNGEISAVVNEAQVRMLPVIDRNHQELIGLQSGITPPRPLFTVPEDPERNRYYATNGQSPFINMYNVDGISNQEPFRGAEIRVHPDENIHDMLISTSNYTESKGFSGGAVVNTTTMAGTNQLHGSLFEFHSGDDLIARNFFNSPNNPDSRLVYNQFGATVGGPVVKNSTYFFGSYEGTYRRGTQTQVATVPTAAVAAGNFSSVPGFAIYSPFSGTPSGTGRTLIGNTIPAALINPSAAAIASFLPAPNQAGFVDNLVTNVPLQDDMQRLDGRIDQHFSGSTSAFLRYGYTNSRGLQGSPLGNVIGAASRGREVGQNAAIDFTHTFGPSLVADARFGYNRYTNNLTSAADLTALGATAPFSTFNGQLFSVNIPGLPAIGTPFNAPVHGVDNTFNWNASATWSKSMHNVRAGIDISRIRSDGFFAPMFGAAGTGNFGPGATMLNSPATTLTPTNVLFNSYAAFLMGAPSQFGVSNFVTTPTVRQTQYGIWAGDHINLRPRLSIDVGLRYEIYTPFEPSKSSGAAFYNPANNTFNFAGVGTTPMHAYDHDYDSIGPRFGFAYRATDKTVIRGGYGISYFQPAYMSTGIMAPTNGAVAGVTGTFATASLPVPFGPSLAGQLLPPTPIITSNGLPAGNVPVRFVPGSLDQPYVQSFSFQVQQELMASTMVSAAYVGTLGRHLPFNEQLNAAAPGTGIAGMPFVGFGRIASTQFVDNALTNNYNSLQVSLTRRFQHGLSVLASYTYSKALGYTTNTGTLLNPTNLGVNYGPLDYDRRNILSVSHMWDLPFGRHGSHWKETLLGGWQLNGILTWQTGTPLTVLADPLLCNCPGNTVLASLNGSGSPYLNNGPSFLNPAAFSAPPGATFGNLNRGSLRGTDMTNYNMSLFKHFRRHDRLDVELRGEAYNISNTAHFANPNTNFLTPDFGRVLSTEGIGSRQLNVAVRAVF
jgi:hypothetical protein